VEEYDVVMLQELFKLHLPWGAVGEWRDRVVGGWPHHHQASHAPPRWFQQDTGTRMHAQPLVAGRVSV
jgi:hypothetical protein